MHQIYKADNKNSVLILNLMHVVLSQIISTPLGPWLSSQQHYYLITKQEDECQYLVDYRLVKITMMNIIKH